MEDKWVNRLITIWKDVWMDRQIEDTRWMANGWWMEDRWMDGLWMNSWLNAGWIDGWIAGYIEVAWVDRQADRWMLNGWKVSNGCTNGQVQS